MPLLRYFGFVGSALLSLLLALNRLLPEVKTECANGDTEKPVIRTVKPRSNAAIDRPVPAASVIDCR
jgi:hypothetical protein